MTQVEYPEVQGFILSVQKAVRDIHILAAVLIVMILLNLYICPTP